MVLRSASSFICATISTSDVAASVATQVTRPLASNLGRNHSPSSMSLLLDDVDTVFFRNLAMRRAHHGKKPLLLRRIVAEHAGVAAGEGTRAVLGDAPDRHAGMLGLDQNGDAARLENL